MKTAKKKSAAVPHAEMERRRKISETMKVRMKGRKFSAEHRRKISEAMKGNKLAVGHRVTAKQIANLFKHRKAGKKGVVAPKTVRPKKARHAHPE